MFLVEITIRSEQEYWQVVELVLGEEIHPEERLGEGRMRAHVLMTEDQFAEAQRGGGKMLPMTGSCLGRPT